MDVVDSDEEVDELEEIEEISDGDGDSSDEESSEDEQLIWTSKRRRKTTSAETIPTQVEDQGGSKAIIPSQAAQSQPTQSTTEPAASSLEAKTSALVVEAQAPTLVDEQNEHLARSSGSRRRAYPQDEGRTHNFNLLVPSSTAEALTASVEPLETSSRLTTRQRRDFAAVLREFPENAKSRMGHFTRHRPNVGKKTVAGIELAVERKEARLKRLVERRRRNEALANGLELLEDQVDELHSPDEAAERLAAARTMPRRRTVLFPQAPQIELDEHNKVVISTSSLSYRPEVPGTRLKSQDPLAVDGYVDRGSELPVHVTAGTFKSIRKSIHVPRWRPEETKQFYRALRKYGTDFSTMSCEFPNRTRQNLRDKFRREEKINSKLITLSLRPELRLPIDFDVVEDGVKAPVTFFEDDGSMKPRVAAVLERADAEEGDEREFDDLRTVDAERRARRLAREAAEERREGELVAEQMRVAVEKGIAQVSHKRNRRHDAQLKKKRRAEEKLAQQRNKDRAKRSSTRTTKTKKASTTTAVESSSSSESSSEEDDGSSADDELVKTATRRTTTRPIQVNRIIKRTGASKSRPRPSSKRAA